MKTLLRGVAAGLLLLCPLLAVAEDKKPDYAEAVQLAVEQAANPAGWRPASLFVIPDAPGGPQGLTYDGSNLIVRTATKSAYVRNNYVGQAGYRIYGQPTTDAAWVTTGNDATRFLVATGATGVDVTTLLERGLGMKDTGTHDAIVEYAVDTQYLLRPTRNPDISQYLPEQYGTNLPFVQPSGMRDETFNNFKTYYANWMAGAYGEANPFPWTQLGYTFHWGNGYSLENINGMSEFILLGQTPVQLAGIYATQSYIYTRNQGGVFSTEADAQFGNGFASFRVDGACNTIWAGHRFQKGVAHDMDHPNRIVITPEGIVSGGQGILVWSLNYEVENRGAITGETGTKFGIAGTENVAVLFKGDATADFGTPVTEGLNRLYNEGVISSPGIAVKVEAGDSDIANGANGVISGGIAGIDTAAGRDNIRVSGGFLYGGTTGISTGVGRDKVNIYGGTVSGGVSGITTGDGKDKIKIYGGVVSGGEYAIKTGKDDDKIVFRGGEIAGRIDMGAGTDRLMIKGIGDPRFSFTLDRSTAAAGQIVNTEEVTLAEGSKATIAVDAGRLGLIRNSERFLVVEADALNVDPAQLTVLGDSRRPMVTFRAEKSGNQLSLVAVRDRSYYGRGSGNASLGAALESLVEGGAGEMPEILDELDGSGNAGNARQLEPNVNGSLQAGFATAGLFNRSVMGRIGQVWAGGFGASGFTGLSTGDGSAEEGIWAQGFGGEVRQESEGGQPGYRAEVWGGAFGYDRRLFAHLMAGFGGGYARNRIAGLDDLSRNDVDSYQAHVYGSLARDACRLDAILSFAYHAYKASRRIAFGGIDRTAKSDYAGQQYSLFVEGGYAFEGAGLVVTPLASLQVMRLHINGYAETGAGAADLTVAAQDYNLFESGLGARLAYPVLQEGLRITPELHAKWLYDFAGSRQQATSRFSGSGVSFSTQGIEPAQSSVNVGAKLSLETQCNMTFSLNYDLEKKAGFTGHAFLVHVRYAF